MNNIQKNQSMNMKRTSEEKRQIYFEVKELVDSGKKIVEAKKIVAKKHGISWDTIKLWDREYRIFSSEAKMWTEEERKQICSEVKKLIDSGKTSDEAEKIVGKKYGVFRGTIRVWDREYRIFSSEVKIWTEEEKKQICSEVKEFIDSGKKIDEAKKIVANKYGISWETIRVWDHEYRIFSSEIKMWSKEEKIEICNLVKCLMDEFGWSAKRAIRYICIEQQYKNLCHPRMIYDFNKEVGPIFYTRSYKSLSPYSDKEKREILENINKGLKVEDVVSKYGLSTSTIYRWNRDLKVFKIKSQIMDEGRKKLEQKIAMEEAVKNVKNSPIDVISDNNKGR